MAMSTVPVLSSTASRLLRHQLTKNVMARSVPTLRIGCGSTTFSVVGANFTATVRRQFADTGGAAGLRRTKNSGRHTTAAFPKSQSSTSGGGGGLESDPHSIANERVSAAADFGLRTPGTEAVATLTTEQKLSNYAMASGLLAFVSYIFYYSLASVGGVEQAKALLFGARDDAALDQEGGASVNPGFEEFLKEANEGRAVEEKRMKDEQKARQEANELAELESSTAARLKAQGMDDLTVAGSASEEEEREMARVAGFVDENGATAVGQKRPLWKRVVFFWRRE